MVQIPHTIRPALATAVKHQFWILLSLVPLVVLPTMFLARDKLAAEIDSARSQIDGRLSAMKKVAGTQPHPNESWAAEIGKATTRVKKETLDEWEKFWQSQEPLRTWPESLGPDFLQRIAALRPGGKLPRPLLERYQNGVRAIARTLPKRMGADDMMLEGEAGGPSQPMSIPTRPGVGEKPPSMVQWDPADQARVYATFKWEIPPSTTQVLLAQEELWVYGALADAIARVNEPCEGAHSAAVPRVLQLAVGYPAAEDDPGGAAGGRILVPAGAARPDPMGEFDPRSAPGMGPGMGAEEGGAAVGRPPHPRFASGPGAQTAGAGDPTLLDAPAEPDDLLRNWIYVDFSGKPLMATDLATSPDSLLLHLMPFVLRAVVDERKLDAFLVDLATAPMPIDVRQVRINPGAGGLAAATPGGAPAMPGGAAIPSGSRPHDIVVEVRGTVALATPPDRELLGLEPEANDVDDAGGADEPGVPGKQEAAEPGAAGGKGEQS